MDSHRRQQVEQVFHSALERDEREWGAFLKEACAGDQALLSEVESLLQESKSLVETRTIRRSPGDDPALATRVRAVSVVGQTIANYQILSFLGKGGMGEVYACQDLTLERKVAMKLLPAGVTDDRNRVRRFEQEAKAASALNHPNIVSIYGAGESEAGHYIVMELIEGQSLRSLTPLPLSSAAVRNLGIQIAKALEVTHAARLVHRDIKPENIMLRADGLVKVLDFGLARLAGPFAEFGGGITVPGALVGTVKYMSPEQARGEWLTSASDIFSLGIVFYWLATGQHPFEADSTIGYLHSIVSREVIQPSRLNPAISSWMETLLLCMLEKDPDKRLTAAEVVRTLEQPDAAPLASRSPVSLRRSVGRVKELESLHAAFQSVNEGKSFVVGISGEPGQGKTTLVEEFLAGITSRNAALVARGRCSERLAGAEAYLPILEVLDSLLNGLERDAAYAAMKNLAPTWYAQLNPASAAPHQEAPPAQERLKRELAAFLEEISRRQPVVIFLDDVQWTDASSVDLLSYLGAKFDRLRALIVMTFRAPELRSHNRQLVELQLEWQGRGLAREVALDFWTSGDIREYIDLKFPRHVFPAGFPEAVHQRTEGNPLFVSDLLRHLEEREAILQKGQQWVLAVSVPETLTGIPDSVRSMVARKMETLAEDEQKLLMAASVQGNDFEAAVLAKALDADPADIEESLDRLEQKSGFVKLVEEFQYPDRSLTLRFRFVHVLYQNAFYSALRPARRISLSKRVAEALLECHRGQTGKVAAQVAYLFEAARDFERAADHYQTAAQNALLLFASREAEALARRGLEMIGSMPEGAGRAARELGLQSTLASALRDLGTHASGKAQESHRRVHELSRETGDQRAAFFGQVGMFWAAFVSGKFTQARTQTEQCLKTAEQLGDAGLIMQVHYLAGHLMYNLGQHAECVRRVQLALALFDPESHSKLVEIFGMDVRANGLALLGLNLWYLGFPDQARERLKEGVEFARGIPHPVPLTLTLVVQTFLSEALGNLQVMQESASEIVSLAKKHGLQKNTLFWGRFGSGWAASKRGNTIEGWAEMRAAMTDAAAIGMAYLRPTLGCALASSLAEHGRTIEALGLIEEILPQAEEPGPREKLPEDYRLKGELLLRLASEKAGEEALDRALDTAQKCGNLSYELRAATSLARFHRKRGADATGRQVLAGVYDRFTEGFETPDLREAKALLEQLS